MKINHKTLSIISLTLQGGGEEGHRSMRGGGGMAAPPIPTPMKQGGCARSANFVPHQHYSDSARVV